MPVESAGGFWHWAHLRCFTCKHVWRRVLEPCIRQAKLLLMSVLVLQTCCACVAGDGRNAVAYSSAVQLAGGKAATVRMCMSDASRSGGTPLQVSSP